MPRRSRSTAWLIAGATVLSLVPLGFLAYFSLSLAGDAVRHEVEKRVESTASLSAEVVRTELVGLAEVVDSYAGRPTLVRALASERRAAANRELIRYHLTRLRQAREGVVTSFVAGLDGRLIAIVPPTPAIVGKDFSFRDWYRGVTSTRRPYVSRVYRTQASGRPLVVAAAALVRGREGAPVGILVAAYELGHLQEFTDELGRAQNVKLKITDQQGVLAATTNEAPRSLLSRLADRRVADALRGRSGVLELDTPDGRRLSAYTPVAEIGWTVTASVPADTAFAAIGDLRSTVFVIVGMLAFVLLAGIFVLARALQSRRRAEDAALEQAAINERSREALLAQNEQLRELDRLKDSFVASVSHELRTPLTSIRGYLELVREGEAGPLTEEQQQFLDVVDRNADRLLHLVGDLLFVAQLDAGKLALDRKHVDLGRVVREAVDAARPAAGARGIALAIEADGDMAVEGDAARLAQLLDNLLSNALKFTPAGGRVGVRVTDGDGHVVLEVADTGMGISKEDQTRLFQRFFRTSSAAAHAIPGTGLGLAIAKGITEAHGGAISVRSGLGRGTTFRVVLPAAIADPAPVEQPAVGARVSV